MRFGYSGNRKITGNNVCILYRAYEKTTRGRNFVKQESCEDYIKMFVTCFFFLTNRRERFSGNEMFKSWKHYPVTFYPHLCNAYLTPFCINKMELKRVEYHNNRFVIAVCMVMCMVIFLQFVQKNVFFIIQAVP